MEQPQDVKELYNDMLREFGREAQLHKAVEECTELIRALTATLAAHVKEQDNVPTPRLFVTENPALVRETCFGRHGLAAEVTDVMVMCEQIVRMYGLHDLVSERRAELYYYCLVKMRGWGTSIRG